MKAFEYAAPSHVDDAVKLLGAPRRGGPFRRYRPDQPDERLRDLSRTAWSI